MKPTATGSASIVAAAMLLGVSACSRAPELEPAEGVTELEGDIAYTDVAAVQILAKGNGWEGERVVVQHVTPVYLSIYNRGQWPVQVQYSRMSLVDASREVYAALPPFKVEESGGRLELAEGYRVEPLVKYEGFAVAPFYGSIYSGPSATQSRWESSGYYENQYRYWQVQDELPTREMLVSALPEGVIEPGGKVSGYVYFEAVPPSKERVTLAFEIVDARSGKQLGVARIPFEID